MKGLFILGYRIKEIEVENKLEALQDVVDGYIEQITLIQGKAAMLVNEEGRLRGMPSNTLASLVAGISIVGPALLLGVNGEEFCDISEEIKRFVRIRLK